MKERSTTLPKGDAKPGTTGPRSGGRLQRAIDAAVAREIRDALKETEGAVLAAAKVLGISKVSLWKRMKVLGITVRRK
jgi:transcriptional regulator of acetoin/glycerol metabolism